MVDLAAAMKRGDTCGHLNKTLSDLLESSSASTERLKSDLLLTSRNTGRWV